MDMPNPFSDLTEKQQSQKQGPDARRRQQQRPAQVRARRHARELPHDEFELIFDQREVGSRLIGLSQREAVFGWHAHVMNGVS
jgi:hypothetical protein